MGIFLKIFLENFLKYISAFILIYCLSALNIGTSVSFHEWLNSDQKNCLKWVLIIKTYPLCSQQVWIQKVLLTDPVILSHSESWHQDYEGVVRSKHGRLSMHSAFLSQTCCKGRRSVHRMEEPVAR